MVSARIVVHRAAVLLVLFLSLMGLAAAVRVALLTSPPTDPASIAAHPGSAHLPAHELASYRVTLGDMEAGVLETRLEKVEHDGRDGRRLHYRLVAAPEVERLWSFYLEGSTTVDAATGWALRAQTMRRSEGTEKRTEVEFAGRGRLARVRIEESDEEEPDLEQVPVATPLDFPAALLRLRTLPSCDDVVLQALQGDHLYELRPREAGSEWLRTPAGRLLCRRLEVEVRELDPEGEEPPRQRPAATVWLASRSGALVCLQVDVLIGRLRALLVPRSAGLRD